MSLNKRKESAALFELIGKSTLRVPKKADSGALQIPKWWANKTPPPPEYQVGGEAVVDATDASDTPDAATAGASTARSSSKPLRPTSPGPARAHPGRPMLPVRRRSPLMAIALGAVVLGLLGGGGYAGYRFWSQRHAAGAGKTGAAATMPAVPGVVQPQVSEVRTGRTDLPKGVSVNTPPAAKGRIIPSNEMQWQPNLLYMRLAAPPKEDGALKLAQYLADNGVDVVIERQTSRTGWLFVILAAKGFPKPDDAEAEAFRKRIVDLGRTHPDAKKAKKGLFDDAYFGRVARMAG